MKKIINFLGIILAIIFVILLNCQQPASEKKDDTKKGKSSDDPSPTTPTLKASKIAASNEHTVVLLNNGTVKCWGRNNTGQLGYGDLNDRGDNPDEMGANLPTVDLGTGRTAVQIVVGEYHTVVLLDNGTVKCWGRNIEGQLGYGDTDYRGVASGEMGDALLTVNLGTGRTAVQIAAGGYHTVVLLDNGTVKCWGNNVYGQLGYGDTDTRGDGSGEMGDALPTVDLGTGRTAVQIQAGYSHTVVLLDNGTIKCWGRNGDGQLGYGDMTDRGDNGGEMGDTLLAIDLGAAFIPEQITVGYYSNAVLSSSDKIKCWGWNGSGNLGYEDINDRGDNVDEMGDFLDSVDLDLVSLPVKAVMGYNHTSAIFADGTIKCWGNNNFGQLGYGDIEMRGNESGEMGSDLDIVDVGTGRTVKEIAIGRYYTAVILDNGLVKCWGRNNCGQLGYGDTDARGDNADEMGDNLPYVSLW